jgi:hypothetical protein
MGFEIDRVRLNGYIRGNPSNRDFRTWFWDRGVPDKVDLRSHCTRVENQGDIGSCTSNAAVGALEYLYSKSGEPVELSRLFVYYNSRRLNGTVPEDQGATIREAMASILAYGTCRETIWPYDPELFSKEPPQAAYEDALKHDAIQYARVAGVKGCINALAEGFPVVFGTFIPRRCYDEAATTGVMPMPTEKERRASGNYGHAMLMVGYDKNERMFIVRNSWGEVWGDGGYCKMPFGIAETCSRPDEFWILSELEQAGNFSLVRPGRGTPTVAPAVNAAPAAPSMKLGGLGDTAARLRDQVRSGLEADLAASSRKIENLLSGKTDQKIAHRSSAPAPPTPKGWFDELPDWSRFDWFRMIVCPDCQGLGICLQCFGGNLECPNCEGRTICPSCKGFGAIQK